MPMQPDPLNNIMNLLRNQGAIDPNQKAARGANLQDQARAHGIRGGVQPAMPGMPPGMGGMPQQGMPMQGDPGGGMPSTEEGTETGMEEAGMDYRLLLSDQMNETILSIKQAIHHSQDKEEIRELEKKAQRIRKDIVDLGGEPIYADESIEEGIEKLKGHGYIGRDRADPTLAGTIYADPYDQDADYTSDYGATPESVDWHRVRSTGATGATGGGGGGARGARSPTTWEERRTGYYQDQPQGGDLDPYGGMGSDTWGAPEGAPEPGPGPYDDLYRPPGGGIPSPEPVDSLGQIMLGIGEEREQDAWLTSWIQDRMEQDAPQMPELQYDMDTFNSMMEEHGLTPRSQQEIDDAAAAITERQRLAKSQLVQRELDKFNREFPNEFEKAKDRLFESGAQYKGVQQEEFAGRGMFYSSVMSGQMKEIDSEVMGHINDISVAAANRVMELEDELRDIAEWAIVEEEALRHELMMEEDDRRFKIGTMAHNAAIQFDQNMLTRAFNQASIDIQWADKQLQEARFMMERQDLQDTQAGAAAMLNNPLISSQLKAAGLTAEQISAMPIGQQAALASNALIFSEFDLTKRQAEMNMWATQAQMNLNERKFSLSLRQAEEALGVADEGGFGELDSYAFKLLEVPASQFKGSLWAMQDRLDSGQPLNTDQIQTVGNVLGAASHILNTGLYDSEATAKFARDIQRDAQGVIDSHLSIGEDEAGDGEGWFMGLRRSLNLVPDTTMTQDQRSRQTHFDSP